MADTTQSSPELLTLQAKLQILNEMNARLQALRKIPAHLVRQPKSTNISLSPSLHPVLHPHPEPSLRQDIQDVKDFAETVRSEKVQEALVHARDSEKKDKSDLDLHRPRVIRKRKRQSTPESPRSYNNPQPQRTSLFSPAHDSVPPVNISELIDFVREFNKTNPKIRLQIVAADRHRPLVCPILVRFTIRDIATVFLTLDSKDDSVLIKPPHSHSDFIVFQKLSQQVTKMILSQPQISVRVVLELLCSYQHVFTQRCTYCERILSAEAPIPAVARVWSDKASDGTTPGWQPWHPTCLQR
ncbi:uncharacterized protein LAESUDRAFT_760900 [Laetiporus sulphureus 93-53]|uniref:Mediator complex subunit 27 n=1 Tax=Laetiporus sulphureus 93-53 TaxID=1314785 RepID=A0A165DD69_9APHY|nr:uncharacterized protein LAESUDRAFT_760900 [Laetiporus sulphureus 93-53]KZT04606.1 hypothetical protein LAESUDRAFT_760900 [Laetiporus sulphureus 93-53]